MAELPMAIFFWLMNITIIIHFSLFLGVAYFFWKAK